MLHWIDFFFFFLRESFGLIGYEDEQIFFSDNLVCMSGQLTYTLTRILNFLIILDV